MGIVAGDYPGFCIFEAVLQRGENYGCQHKRPGRKAKNKRKERVVRKNVVVQFPGARRKIFDGFSPGRLVACGIQRYEIFEEMIKLEQKK